MNLNSILTHMLNSARTVARAIKNIGSVPSLSHSNKPLTFYVGIGFTIISSILVASFLLVYLHRQAKLTASTSIHSLSESIVQTFDGVIGQIDLILQISANQISISKKTNYNSNQKITNIIEENRLKVGFIDFSRATDENGNVIYGTDIPQNSINVSDRDYFIYLRDHPDAGLYINKPLMSKINQTWSWVFARRLNGENGQFLGVIFVGMFVSHIEKLLSNIEMKPGSSIGIRGYSYELVARKTFKIGNPIKIGDIKIPDVFQDALILNPLEGEFISDWSGNDIVNRLYHYERSSLYGFTVVVGNTIESIFEEWWSQVWIIAGFVTVFVTAILMFSRSIILLWKRQEQDMEALSNNETRFRTIIESSPIPLVICDGRKTINYINQAFTNAFGYNSNEVSSTSKWPLTSDQVEMDWTNYFNEAKFQAVSSNPIELTIVCKDGAVRKVTSSATFFRNGNDDAYIITFFDITDRKILEHELIHAKERAEQVNKAKSVFMAMVSHELRTPLNSVIGFSDLIISNPGGQSGALDVVEYARYIQQSGFDLLRVVNDILEISKIEAGIVTIEPDNIDAGTIIANCLRNFVAETYERDLTISTEIEYPGFLIWADEKAIKQVLHNLISNAIKFTPNGGKITISARSTPAGRVFGRDTQHFDSFW
ncbi:MAG: PAS domain S-box protein [Rhodospirillaceae bacterium]